MPSNTLFFNIKWTVSEEIVPPLFTIVHEMRHAMQFHLPEEFSSIIQKKFAIMLLLQMNELYILMNIYINY
jgi:hypothetical protein